MGVVPAGLMETRFAGCLGGEAGTCGGGGCLVPRPNSLLQFWQQGTGGAVWLPVEAQTLLPHAAGPAGSPADAVLDRMGETERRKAGVVQQRLMWGAQYHAVIYCGRRGLREQVRREVLEPGALIDRPAAVS